MQGTSGMCGLHVFAFLLLPQGKVCACRVTLHLRKPLFALFSIWRFTYYIYAVFLDGRSFIFWQSLVFTEVPYAC